MSNESPAVDSRSLMSLGGLSAAAGSPFMAQQAQPKAITIFLPLCARAQNYEVAEVIELRSYRRQRRPVAHLPGGTQEVFNSAGPGVITHIWLSPPSA